MVDDGYLSAEFTPEESFKFVCYDTETLETKNEMNSSNLLKLISIGVNNNLNNSEKYFQRISSADSDGQILVDAFMDHLLELYQLYETGIDVEIISALERIEAELQEEGFNSQLTQYQRVLNSYTKLNIFGFNSSKFDAVLLLPYVSWSD